jgi:acetyl esterase/lipase
VAALGASADLTGRSDPLQQFVAIVRALVPRYGDVGPAPGLEGVDFVPTTANGVAAEWVTTKASDPSRRIVFTHGGGWIGGSPLHYRGITGTLARLSDASVLAVGYRLAPEHRFPAGLNDCVTAFKWATANGPTGNGRAAEHLSLVGDSAGANLAAATTLELAACDERLPDHLVLIAGILDNTPQADRIGIDDPIGTPESLAAAIALYLDANDTPSDYRISPVYAPADLLAKFPPTLLQASAIEALSYDSKKFAARLENVGVRINLSLWPELPHVWHAFLSLFPEATAALREIADFVAPADLSLAD